MPCAIPPLDMRYARVVDQNAQGIDLMAFSAGRGAISAPAVACLPGRIHRYSMARYEYRNNVILETDVGFICYSGLAFGGRAADGTTVARGAVIGQIETPGRISMLRIRDRTAGASPTYPYLHIEAWNRMPPLFVSRLTHNGTTWSLSDGAISPASFWGMLGIDFVGPEHSQIMAIRRGGPSDCGGA